MPTHPPAHVRRRAALVACAALAACALPAGAASADLAPPIAPDQYFTGVVHGTNSATAFPSIAVLCAGPASTGTPAPGQSVAVNLLVPPTAATAGFTGSLADSIQVDLIWSVPNPPITVVTSIATLTQYATPAPIPTDIKVPCSGTGEMSFMPAPTSKTAVASTVKVTFVSTGVSPGA